MAFQRYPSFPATDVYSEASKIAVWNKGTIIPGYDPRTWRRDICGRAMKFEKYGLCEEYGWEIDHIRPVSRGGTDSLSNLQPLFWENNRRKGDTFPWYG